MFGTTLDGTNMLGAMIDNQPSPHRGIVHYADRWGNVSYQYDMMKLIHTSLIERGFYTPDEVFLGDAKEATVCMV